ncbi:MAG: VOC family protein [Pirellulales bacterium]|nr:VOC family protein [Pirellulales bacterium]
MTTPDPLGSIVWRDLTVANAEQICEFYRDVVGWKSTPVKVGEYHDFNMHAEGDEDGTAGICHAQGANANLPAQWLIYITVPSVEDAANRCRELGGKVLDGPRSLGSRLFCVIQDPAGAVCALIEPPAS